METMITPIAYKVSARYQCALFSLRWRHNDHAGVSNHQPCGCLLNRLFRRKSKKTSKLRVTGLCAGNSPGTGEFPAQMASYAENVSIWWRHHVSAPSHPLPWDLWLIGKVAASEPKIGWNWSPANREKLGIIICHTAANDGMPEHHAA